MTSFINTAHALSSALDSAMGVIGALSGDYKTHLEEQQEKIRQLEIDKATLERAMVQQESCLTSVRQACVNLKGCLEAANAEEVRMKELWTLANRRCNELSEENLRLKQQRRKKRK